MGLIGSALGVGAAIFGGISASRAAKKAKKGIEAQRKKNQEWYDRRYNEDATQRADAQRMLTDMEERIKNRNRQVAGAQAVMGGTEESVAAAKAANAAAMADATSQIVANGEARKDAIEQQYMQNDAAYQDQLNQIEQNRANAISGAVGGAANAFGGLDFGAIGKKGIAL